MAHFTNPCGVERNPVMKKRIFAVLLAALLLSSCGSAGVEETADPVETAAQTEAVTETETEKLLPDLPEDDFEGYEFTMLTKGYYSTHWYSMEAYAEELTGEPVNDAVYNRNAVIGEKYNFTVAEAYGASEDPSGDLKKAVQAGEDMYDLLLIGGTVLGSLAQQGFLVDLTTMPHMDLSKPWYDQSANASLSIANKLHMTAGDLNIMDNNATWALLFNKSLAEDIGTEDLYQLVTEGKWTLDLLEEYATLAARDLNGDGVQNEFDQWGIQGEGFNTMALIQGGGAFPFGKDENDIPVITIQDEHFYDAFAKANAINGNFDICMFVNNFTGYSDVWAECMDLAFTEGRVLFACVGLNRVTLFREMEGDFGILPLPKYDEDQEKYHDLISLWSANMISIPKTMSDANRTGIIVEALSAESKYTLTPAYYDKTLKTKSARDEESAAMLDLIFEARAFDLGLMYSLGGMFDVPGSLTQSGKTDLASSIESKMKGTQAAIDKLVEAIQKTE